MISVLKYAGAAILATAFLLAAPPAGADQSDPRLDGLFSALAEAESAAERQKIEQQIWRIWRHSGNAAVTVLMNTGAKALDREDFRGALVAFDKVVQKAPNYAEGWNQRALTYYLIGQYQHSLDDIRKVLALEPRHFGALNGRGLIYMELDQPEKALTAFERALEVHPQMPGAKVNAELARQAIGGSRL